jgi:hypothetical protein
MAFSFDSDALLSSEEVSKFVFNVDDATTDLTPALTTQQIFSIQLLVNSISKQFKTHCDCGIVAANYTEVWDGAASDELVPRERPINSVGSIKLAGNGDFDSATVLPSTVYVSDRYSIKFRGGYQTPRGRGLIQVVYNAGYSTVPQDIVFAALLQFQWAYKQIGKGDAFVGIKQISKMQESQVKDDSIGVFGLRQEVVGLLKDYRRFEVPQSVMFSRVS